MNAVTVMLATRDRVQLLARALQSVWDQEGVGPLTAVVVFDGPVPDEAAALPTPTRPGDRLVITLNEQHPGLAGARNHGLALADDDVVAIFDDDDVWHPHKLSRQLRLLQQHPQTALVGGGIRVVTAGARSVVRTPPAVVTHADLVADRVMALHSSTFVARRAALLAIGGWDTELEKGQGEDYDLLLRVARAYGPIRAVDGLVADIHWDSGSYYRSNWQALASALTMLLDKHPEFASNPRGRARIEGQIAYAHAAMGNRGESRRWQRRSRADHWREPRAALAALVASGVVSSRQVEKVLHAVGRGI